MVIGFGDSMEEPAANHDKKVGELSSWSKQHAVKLNPDKMQFNIPFIGHVAFKDIAYMLIQQR